MLRFLSTLRTGLMAGARRVLQTLRTVPALWGRLQPRSWRAWLLLVLALPALLAVYTLLLIPFTPSIADITKAKTERPAQLLSVDGKVLAEYRWANREWVALNRISPHVVNALIATEDHRFYEHSGMDFRRTASSVVHTLRGDPQGGSTITQQLARNLFPEEIGRSRTITRKLKEAITAFKIEWTYSKDEILETYLNTVPFLYNAYGIEMAARTYFDKSADKLNLLESATLIGMLKGTAYYNPVTQPERSQARRNIVLAQMVKRGKLEESKLAALQKRPLRIDFERQTEAMGLAPHFAQQLRKQLIAWADANGYSLHADGLIVRTTIDSRLQAMANQAVARQGRQLQGIADNAWSARNGWNPKSELVQALVRETPQYREAVAKGEPADEVLKSLLADTRFMTALKQEKTRVQAGFMAMDPVTGHVLAWVGSRDFAADPFDHVQAARRQPGSTFKPFVYGAAFMQGALPTDELMDEAVEIPLGGNQVWRPTDGGAPSNAPMTLADGLAPWACARASWKKCHRWPWAPARSRCAKWSPPTAPSPMRAATWSPSSSPALKTATARCCKPLRRPRPSRPCPCRPHKPCATPCAAPSTGAPALHCAAATACGPTWRAKPAPRKTTPTAGSLPCTPAWWRVRGWASTMGASPCAAITGARAPTARCPWWATFCSRPSAPTPWTAATGLWTKKPPVCWAMP